MRTSMGFFTLAVVLCTGACESGDSDTSESSSGTTQVDDTGSGATGSPTGSTDASSGEIPTTGDDSDTAPVSDDDGGDHGDPDTTTGVDTTDSDTDAPDDTTGEASEPDPEIVAACTAYCMRWTECGVQPNEADCIAGCADSIGPVDDACKAAHQAELACATALSCPELFDTLGDGGPCADAHAAVATACEGFDDSCIGVSGESDAGCDYSEICEGEPDRSMQCDDTTCTCLSGETKVGECAAEGVCRDVDGLAAKAKACCDF